MKVIATISREEKALLGMIRRSYGCELLINMDSPNYFKYKQLIKKGLLIAIPHHLFNNYVYLKFEL